MAWSMDEGTGQSLEAPWSPPQPVDGCLRAREPVNEVRFINPSLKGVPLQFKACIRGKQG